MMNRCALILLFLGGVIAAKERPAESGAGAAAQLETLTTRLASVRDSLQTEIAERWRLKQSYIKQRETDKDELGRIRDAQEKAYNDLSRVKEERFTRERAIADELQAVQQKKDGWVFVTKTVDELFDKEAGTINGMFPLDRETRRLTLENIRRSYQENQRLVPALNGFAAYKLKYIVDGTRTSVTKQTVMPNDGEPEAMTVARFGQVFSYACNAENRVFIIRQTGLLGMNRFTIEEVVEPQLHQELTHLFPAWVDKKAPQGIVPVDVLQNAQSGGLISGQKSDAFVQVREYIRAGGPVMIPLLLLPVWALVLIILKLVQFAMKHKSGSDLSRYVMKKLADGDIAGAREYAKKKRGIVANIVATCLDHSEWNRDVAEKAIRGVIVDELPQLNSHLNTLAVIAGIAPLLGLLGTVSGMINLFEVITHYGTGDPKIMAGGISEALITTQTGLSIAIPILLFHNYIRNGRDKIKAEMEKHAILILNKLWPGA